MWWIGTSLGCPQSWCFFCAKWDYTIKCCPLREGMLIHFILAAGHEIFWLKKYRISFHSWSYSYFFSYFPHTSMLVGYSKSLSWSVLCQHHCGFWQMHVYMCADFHRWRSEWILKLYEKDALSVSAAVECCKSLRILMDFMALYNSYEPQHKQLKSVYFLFFLKKEKEKEYYFVFSSIVQKLCLMDGCHQFICFVVIFLNTESWYRCLKLWSAVAFQLPELGIMNWSMKDVPLTVDIME